MLSVLVVGCGSQRADLSVQNSAVVPAPVPSPTPEPEPVIPAAPPAALTPLPTTAQVQGSVRRGRVDPFAPVQGVATGTGGQAAGQGPGALTVQGVMAVGRSLQALVRTASGSGVICVGQAGRCTAEQEPLLPQQWSVLSIDLQRGCLTYAVEGKVQPPVCITPPKA